MAYGDDVTGSRVLDAPDAVAIGERAELERLKSVIGTHAAAVGDNDPAIVNGVSCKVPAESCCDGARSQRSRWRSSTPTYWKPRFS